MNPTRAIITFLVLTHALMYAQAPRYEFSLAFGKPFPEERLREPRTLGDLIPYFPDSWVESWKHTRITLSNGPAQSGADGRTEQLSSAQRELLSRARIGDHMTIEAVGYRANPITGKQEEQVMRSEYTILPASSAQPKVQMAKWLQSLQLETARRLSVPVEQLPDGASVIFKIDAAGKVSDLRMTASSGNTRADRVILDLIREMGLWQPAHNGNGERHAQEFVLSLVKQDC